MGLTWHHRWCQSGAMNLDLYMENLNRHRGVPAEAGGEEARALVERLIAPLEAAIRLTLQDALAAAAEEITTELAPGSGGLGRGGGRRHPPHWRRDRSSCACADAPPSSWSQHHPPTRPPTRLPMTGPRAS